MCVVIMDKHIDECLSYGNRLKHLFLKTELRCDFCPCPVFNKESVYHTVCRLKKTAEAIFGRFNKITLVCSSVSGNLERHMIVVRHEIGNEVVLSVWSQKIKSFRKLIIELMPPLFVIDFQDVEREILLRRDDILQSCRHAF